MKEALKYLQAGAIVPVDMETTILLVNALKEALAQPAQEQREWVDLTDEDINTTYWKREPFRRPTPIEFAHDILTKFKEKNNAP